MIGKFRNHAWESRIISERYFKEKESEKAIVQPHNINSAYPYKSHRSNPSTPKYLDTQTLILFSLVFSLYAA